MSIGYQFICKKCHEKNIIWVGTIWDIEGTYNGNLKRIKQGEFGKEWQNLLLNNKDIVFNTNEVLYVCKSCRNWRNEPDLTLFIPKDPENKPERFNPYDVMLSDYEKKGYRLLKKRIRKCDICGEIMTKHPICGPIETLELSDKSEEKEEPFGKMLRCHHCGTVRRVDLRIFCCAD